MAVASLGIFLGVIDFIALLGIMLTTGRSK